MVTSRPRISACDAVRVALGLLLVAAAALKAHQLATQPLPERDLLSSRWFLVLWVEAEIAVGLWLLSGLGRRAGWGAALACAAAWPARAEPTAGRCVRIRRTSVTLPMRTGGPST